MPVRFWLLLVAEVASVSGLSSFPTLMPELLTAWALSPTDAGTINGAFFAGYAAGSPLLTGLTDRVDARRIYAISALVSVLAQLAFAHVARDVFTASLCRALYGVGVAGTFMPALSLMPDLGDPARTSRAISTYTATFGIGVSLSYVLTGLVRALCDVRTTLSLIALLPLVGLAIVARFPRSERKHGAPGVLAGLARAVRHRPALRYGLAYAGHCAELFALRSWAVVLLANELGSLATSALFAPVVAAVTNSVGAPFSVLGNEAALRRGRASWIARVLVAAPWFAFAVGLSLAGPAWLTFGALLAYAALVSLDSGAITAGTLEAAPPELRGAVAALHTTLGFLGGFVGPLLVGVALDATGGPRSQLGFTLGFGAVSLLACASGLPIILAARRTRHAA